MNNLIKFRKHLMCLLVSALFSLSAFAQGGQGVITLTGTQGLVYLNTHPKYAAISPLTVSTAKKAYNAATGANYQYNDTRAAGDKWETFATAGSTYTWSTTTPASNVVNLALKENGTATTIQTTITTTGGVVLTGVANNLNLAFDPSSVTYTTTNVPPFRSVEDVTIAAGRMWQASTDNVMGEPAGTLHIKSALFLALNRYRQEFIHRFQRLL